MPPPIANTQGMLARAVAAHQTGNIAEAEFLYKLVLQSDKKQFDALHMLALIEWQHGNRSEAARRLQEALRIRPNSADGLINLGRMESELHDHANAVRSYQKALALDPKSALAHNNFSIVLRRLRRFEEGVAHCQAAIEIAPDYADPWCNRGNILFDLHRNKEAIASYDRALAIAPNLATAWHGRGWALYEDRRYEEAWVSFEKCSALEPDLTFAEGDRIRAKMHICNWDNQGAEWARLAAAVRHGARQSRPFVMVVTSPSPADQLICAQQYVADLFPPLHQPLWRGERYRHARIRLAYVSGDFHDHAVALLTAGLFESHDPSRFETTAVSLGPDVNDDMRMRLRSAFDRFLSMRERGDREIAETLRNLEIDIAVDMLGFTAYARPSIFQHRGAPIQVNYLGYPGTMGAGYIDYIVADKTVIPPEDAAFYAEKIAWLPDTYQANDARRRVSEAAPTRNELHLPEDGFVFCCFNNSFKITPPPFDIWMRLLKQVEGSVLWLLADNEPATRNLYLEAERRGVARERLVFAPRMALEDHLRRHKQADLFLDTLPYNGHTTASDALWEGVPIVTCLGSAFAGRVAASLLRAIGLPELVTGSLSDYEALALTIATDPAFCASLKQKLARNRQVFPLFDTQRYTRHIEAAYETMWQRHQRGEPPQSFSVEPA
jgi:predicted O-linked N-acetylglucosamine transferase (SPINDLY family)